MHITDPLTDEELIIDSSRAITESGEHTVTWDFSGHGYAYRIQTDNFGVLFEADPAGLRDPDALEKYPPAPDDSPS